jgi:hypothetical protein
VKQLICQVNNLYADNCDCTIPVGNIMQNFALTVGCLVIVELLVNNDFEEVLPCAPRCQP